MMEAARKGAKRVRGDGSSALIAQPTMRLISLANCISTDEKFGLKALDTSPAMATPIEHSAYELTELPQPTLRPLRGMPWEESDEDFLRFRAELPPTLTPATLCSHVVLPVGKQTDGVQRSDEWHKQRSFAVTASQFASAAHENPNMSSKKLLSEKVYPKRGGFQGNAYTEWGSVHEKHAEEAFIAFLSKFPESGALEHPSHIRHSSSAWLGFSPDALLWSADRKEVALVEYKCPAYQRSGPGHPYAAKNALCIPRQYMPQIQGSMHILREYLREHHPGVECVRTWFVVWQAHQFFVTHVPFVPQFANRIVHASSSFFHEEFIPACVEAIKEKEESVRQAAARQAAQSAPPPAPQSS